MDAGLVHHGIIVGMNPAPNTLTGFLAEDVSGLFYQPIPRTHDFDLLSRYQGRTTSKRIGPGFAAIMGPFKADAQRKVELLEQMLDEGTDRIHTA